MQPPWASAGAQQGETLHVHPVWQGLLVAQRQQHPADAATDREVLRVWPLRERLPPSGLLHTAAEGRTPNTPCTPTLGQGRVLWSLLTTCGEAACLVLELQESLSAPRAPERPHRTAASLEEAAAGIAPLPRAFLPLSLHHAPPHFWVFQLAPRGQPVAPRSTALLRPAPVSFAGSSEGGRVVFIGSRNAHRSCAPQILQVRTERPVRCGPACPQGCALPALMALLFPLNLSSRR